MPVQVQHDGADGVALQRPDPGLRVAERGLGLLAGLAGGELLAAVIGQQDVELDPCEALLLGEAHRALAGEHPVTALLEQRPGDPDRVRLAAQGGDRAGPAAPAVHDGGVVLDVAVRGEHRAPAGVEVLVVLEDGDRLDDGVDRVAAGEQRAAPRLDGAGEAFLQRGCEIGSDDAPARSTVDDDDRTRDGDRERHADQRRAAKRGCA